MTALLNPWVLLGMLVAALAIGAGGYHLGAKVTAATYEANIIKADQQRATDNAAVAKTINDTAATWAEKYRFLTTQLQVAENTHRIIYNTIREEVPVYVTAKADAGCTVNNGFVLLYDSAFSGTKPEQLAAAAGPGPSNLDGPSGVSLSQVGAVSVDNADACDQWRDKAQSCRAYVNTVTGFYNDLKGSTHVCK